MSTTVTASSRRAYPWLIPIGLALYGLVIWWVGWRGVAQAVRNADLGSLACMAALLGAGFAVRIVKWRYALGPGLPIAPAFFLSKTAGSWSPARVGEFTPMVMRPFRTARAGVWLGADRILEAGTTLALGAWGVAAVGLMPWWLFGAVAAAGLTACAGAMAYGRRRTRDGRISQGRLSGFLHRVQDELVSLGAKLPGLLALTVAAKTLDLAGVVLLYHAFGVRVGWALAAAVRGAHGALSILPDATGVPYVADAALLQQVAGAPPEVWSAAIGVEVAVLHLMLLAGLGVTVLWWRTMRCETCPALGHIPDQSDQSKP